MVRTADRNAVRLNNCLLTDAYKSTSQAVEPEGEKDRYVCLFTWQIIVCLYFMGVQRRLGLFWMTRSSGCNAEHT